MMPMLAVELMPAYCELTQPLMPLKLICHQLLVDVRPETGAVPPTGSRPTRANCVPGPLRMTTLYGLAVTTLPVAPVLLGTVVAAPDAPTTGTPPGFETLTN